MRVVLSLLAEFETSAVLMVVIKTSLVEDVGSVLVVVGAMLLSFGLAAESLYIQVDCETPEDGECYIASRLEMFSTIIREFIWPIAGIDSTHAAGVDSFDGVGERMEMGGVLYFGYGVCPPLPICTYPFLLLLLFFSCCLEGALRAPHSQFTDC